MTAKNLNPISILLAALLCAALLLAFGCERERESGDMEDDVTTTEEETTPAIPAVPVNAKQRISAEELGLTPYKINGSNPSVAEVERLLSGMTVYIKSSGYVSFDIEDCFGHKASVDMTVTTEGEVSYTARPTTERFVEVRLHYGAKGDGVTDDTAAIQKAIDDAKPGDTVYVSPGIYKLTLLVMREGVTLEMYTTMTDATEGFTNTLASQTANGSLTVLRGVRIMNNGNNLPGAEGSSNFTIRGGVFDNEGSTRSTLIFGCADGVLVENVIFKDIKNNHVIQLTGCTNTTVKNCCFAGFIPGDAFTREILQVEVSTPGATGSPPGSPLTFSEGEFNFSSNIEISGCYFGKSDECGPPLMAIGHHSKNGEATVTGFHITGNVFDEVLYAAIRYCNIVDTEISGNTFISTSKYMNATNYTEATTPAFVIIYPASGGTTYSNIVTGQKVTKAVDTEQSGTHNLLIKGNNFVLSAGSDKRIIHVSGPPALPGLTYVSSQLRQNSFDSAPFSYSGFVNYSNYVSELTFTGNSIKIEGQPSYTNYFMFFSNVYNLDLSGNQYTLGSGVSFSSASDGTAGLFTRFIKNGAAAARRTITAQALSKTITFEDAGGGSFTLKAQISLSIILDVESGGGGRIETKADATGNATVTVTPDEGYVFAGWHTSDGQRYTAASAALKSGLILVARFTVK